MTNTTEENKFLYSEAPNSPDFDQDRAELLSEWLKDIHSISRSLDVGCGRGGFSGLLPHNVEKWGIDFEKYPRLPQDFNFISGDISANKLICDNMTGL